jgi:hypothetical protein
MPVQFYPVRSDRLRSALPPAGFRQISAPSTYRYAALFSAADKGFPQISNLECNTVPVTDPNAFTLSCHYNSFPVHSSETCTNCLVTLRFRQLFHNKTNRNFRHEEEPSWEGSCSSAIRQNPHDQLNAKFRCHCHKSPAFFRIPI